MTGKKEGGQQWADLAYPPAGFEDAAANGTAGNASFLQIFADDMAPEDTVVLQFEKKWVELGDCTGKTGEIELAADVSNASVATCKNRPNVKKDGKAKEALDSVTPK